MGRGDASDMLTLVHPRLILPPPADLADSIAKSNAGDDARSRHPTLLSIPNTMRADGGQ